MSDEDKDKYVSAEEATGENEEFKPFTDLDIDLDKTGENVKDSIEKAAPFLKRIDGFIYKNWKKPFFIYFLIAFFITAGDGFIGRSGSWNSLLEINGDGYGGTSISAGRLINDLLYLWSPIIIFLVWKRIFHPND